MVMRSGLFVVTGKRIRGNSKGCAVRVFLATAICVTCSWVAGAQPCVSDPEGGEGQRLPNFLNIWENKYPSSTLPSRMEALTGSSCYICHHPPDVGDPGNCYRSALKTLLDQGSSISEAIDALDGVDSDGDGFTNGEEITKSYPGGEVGYSPGLVGGTGTDPCGTNPSEPVSGVLETPLASAIPAVSRFGYWSITVGLILATAVVWSGRRPARKQIE